MMLSIFSCTCWPFLYLLWQNVYLGLLPTVPVGQEFGHSWDGWVWFRVSCEVGCSQGVGWRCGWLVICKLERTGRSAPIMAPSLSCCFLHLLLRVWCPHNSRGPAEQWAARRSRAPPRLCPTTSKLIYVGEKWTCSGTILMNSGRRSTLSATGSDGNLSGQSRLEPRTLTPSTSCFLGSNMEKWDKLRCWARRPRSPGCLTGDAILKTWVHLSNSISSSVKWGKWFQPHRCWALEWAWQIIETSYLFPTMAGWRLHEW